MFNHVKDVMNKLFGVVDTKLLHNISSNADDYKVKFYYIRIFKGIRLGILNTRASYLPSILRSMLYKLLTLLLFLLSIAASITFIIIMSFQIVALVKIIGG